MSVDKKAVSKDLYQDTAIIQVDVTMSQAVGHNYNAYVSYESQRMKDVLIVDTAAVTVIDDKPYVTVKDKYGKLMKNGFIAASSNGSYYWIYDGLEEGTTVVY